MKLKGNRVLWVVLLWLILIASNSFAQSEIFIRHNQIGYYTNGPKKVLVGGTSRKDIENQKFTLYSISEKKKVGFNLSPKYKGKYNAKAIQMVFEIDFTGFTQKGEYRIECDTATSHPFKIGEDVYKDVISTSLKFYLVQRCGDTDPLCHGKCHLNRSRVVGGIMDGELVDVSGGWHDAGDYLKFLGQSSSTGYFLLLGYQKKPNSFSKSSKNKMPDVLVESKIILKWMMKMWNRENKTLLRQCAKSGTDHWPWRMPEPDDKSLQLVKRERPVYGCKEGTGANYAGRAAATLALASEVYKPFDKEFSKTCLTYAKEIYEFGTENLKSASDESSWRDDMSLGAIELYSATKKSSYLDDSKKWMGQGKERNFTRWCHNSENLHNTAHYRIALADPSYKDQAIRVLKGDAKYVYAKFASANSFSETLDDMQWGSVTEMTGRALTLLYFEELTGDMSFRNLALQQMDYAFGMNPWGISMVSGLGTVWPQNPHHQVADKKINPDAKPLIGYWTAGGIQGKQAMKLNEMRNKKDKYANFQSSHAIFYDDVMDYKANEPTVFANGIGIALTAWIENLYTKRK